MSLNEDQIETALSELDKIPGESLSKSRGPFSVFRIENTNEQLRVIPGVFDQDESLNGQFKTDDVAPRDVHGPLYTTPAEDMADEESRNSEDASFELNYPPHSADRSVEQTTLTQHASHAPKQPDCDISDTTLFGTTLSMTSPSGPLHPEHEQSLGSLFLPPDIPSHEAFLNSEVKYLLRNYAHNVLPIFSPLDSPDTPWRQLHLPRALQCSIELEIIGDSRPSKRALLHCILTISAYNLRNTNSSEKHGATRIQWNRIASCYKGEALRLLETCIGDSSTKISNDVYSELLAAMLAMVTIDVRCPSSYWKLPFFVILTTSQVISGDTRTSEIHLQACETLIREQLTHSDREIPDIIKGLHGIFLYLRVMQEATKLLCNQHDSNGTGHCGSVVSSSPPNDSNGQEDISAFVLSQAATGEFHWWSFELMYALPMGLLLLLRKITKVLDDYRMLGVEHNESVDGSEIRLKIDQLEDEILEWPLEEAVIWLDTAPMSQANRLVMQHYTQAFYQSLIIFYCHKARKMHRRHMQQYVHQVISHLEHVENVNQQFGLRSGSMLWPAFVAGSQAIEPDVQTRFLRWLDLIDREYIWTSNLTKDALMEIWSRDKAHSGATALNPIHLVLT